ncbi:hypothetical protein FB446DRAFT_642700 [Lentinula raphanica]|nr:hypothetical protein FB446DRAFT_642700 [Lentinula raphanica]
MCASANIQQASAAPSHPLPRPDCSRQSLRKESGAQPERYTARRTVPPSASVKAHSKNPKFKDGQAQKPHKPKWVRPALPPVIDQPPTPPPHLPRRHEQRSRQRAARKEQARQGRTTSLATEHRARLAGMASTFTTSFDSDDILSATSGYIGSERVDESVKQMRLTYSLQDLVGEQSPWKFSVVKAHVKNVVPALLSDEAQRVFAVCIPPPAGDPSFGRAADEAADVLDQYRPLFFNESVPFPEHWRGDFPVKAFGVSYGGGQQVPKSLYQSNVDSALVDRIRGMRCFRRLAGHASAAFETWAPKLHELYLQYTLQLERLIPDLGLNFPNSVFSCCTLNLGPRTTTVEHLDHKNYIYGWCGITALGNFDHTQGGHMVLWDLKLVIELPPGWTILIPSAYLRHSNTTLREGDTRFSFTQYTAGGLFRVIDDEGIARTRMTPAEKKHALHLQRERLNTDLNCYSTLEELGVDTKSVHVTVL